MSERTAEATTVDEDGIRVEKSFTDDAFPVPAVLYELSSTREDPVRVRIVDRIPESFPMDRIGFHPEYESDNWTAYKDHRVEFERVVDPGEETETVFGIRDDDPDLDEFLGTPVIEHVPVDKEIEDVLGASDTDAVREVLSGERTTLPGMEESPAPEEGDAAQSSDAPAADASEAVDPGEAVVDGEVTTSDEAAASHTDPPEPREVVAGIAAVTPRDEATAEGGDVDETDVDETDADEPGDAPVDRRDDEPAGAAPASAPREGVAAALAAEIRAGDVDDDDLETLQSELDIGVHRSVDVRIARLQSSVADIEAYADALTEFIDGEGTAREILDELDETVDAIESEMAAVNDRLAAADADRNDLHEAVSRLDDETTGLDEAVGDLGDDVATLDQEVDGTAVGLEATEDRVGDVESRVEQFDEEFDDLWDDLTEVDTRLTDIEDRLGEDLDDVQAELDAINEHLEELEAFRERLNEAFGP